MNFPLVKITWLDATDIDTGWHTIPEIKEKTFERTRPFRKKRFFERLVSGKSLFLDMVFTEDPGC